MMKSDKNEEQKCTSILERIAVGTALALALAAAGGCSTATTTDVDGEEPEAELDGVEAQQIVANNGYTVNAGMTNNANGSVTQSTVFAGPGSRSMGACALQQYLPAQSCTGDGLGKPVGGECDSYPSSLPSGGFRYCVSPSWSGTKYCFYRPGGPTSYCVGSPALGGAPIQPGTYAKTHPAIFGTKWVTMGCFEGCSSINPSVSTLVTATD